MGQLSRAVVDGRTGELLFAAAAGTYSPRGRKADAANLSNLAGVQIEGRPDQRGSRTGDPGRAPPRSRLPRRIRNHYIWARQLAHSHTAAHPTRRRPGTGKA